MQQRPELLLSSEFARLFLSIRQKALEIGESPILCGDVIDIISSPGREGCQLGCSGTRLIHNQESVHLTRRPGRSHEEGYDHDPQSL
jgi:hypothetical protein